MKVDIDFLTVKFIVNSVIDLFRYAGWQILIFLIFIEYKNDIRNIFKFIPNRISKFSLNNVSIEFAQSVDKMQNVVLEEGLSDDIQENNKDFEELLSVSPEYAILDSWKKVENELHDRFNDPKLLNPLEYNEKIRRYNLMSEKDIRLLNHLRHLRNKVLHNRDIIVSKETAQKYREQCLYIIKKLKLENDNPA